MTQQWHPCCDREYGCVEHDHTAQDCYWRYVDDSWDTEGSCSLDILSQDQWQGRVAENLEM